MDITNDFSQLSAESAESVFAKFTPEDHAEYQAWLAWQTDRFETKSNE